MGRDLLAAYGKATASEAAIVGVGEFGNAPLAAQVRYLPARTYAPGEPSTHPRAELIQPRETRGVLGVQPTGGWGLLHGANDRGVVVGLTEWRSRLANEPSELTGPDVVRVALERAQSARQAVDAVADVVERHGQTGPDGDHVFLVVDRHEGYVVEAAGRHWAAQPFSGTRAVCDVAQIRQDWLRLSRGLAELGGERGWWPDDGAKVDFRGGLGDPTSDATPALRRWTRATLALAQQEHSVDPFCMRRLLVDHHEQCVQRTPDAGPWQGSWIYQVAEGQLPLLWASPAHLGSPLFFPLAVGAALPQMWHEGLPAPAPRLRRSEGVDLYDRLQAEFDQDAECIALHAGADQRTFAQDMMTRHADRWRRDAAGQMRPAARPASPRGDAYAFVTE